MRLRNQLEGEKWNLDIGIVGIIILNLNIKKSNFYYCVFDIIVFMYIERN